jgi:hypothetical protein
MDPAHDKACAHAAPRALDQQPITSKDESPPASLQESSTRAATYATLVSTPVSNPCDISTPLSQLVYLHFCIRPTRTPRGGNRSRRGTESKKKAGRGLLWSPPKVMMFLSPEYLSTGVRDRRRSYATETVIFDACVICDGTPQLAALLHAPPLYLHKHVPLQPSLHKHHLSRVESVHAAQTGKQHFGIASTGDALTPCYHKNTEIQHRNATTRASSAGRAAVAPVIQVLRVVCQHEVVPVCVRKQRRDEGPAERIHDEHAPSSLTSRLCCICSTLKSTLRDHSSRTDGKQFNEFGEGKHLSAASSGLTSLPALSSACVQEPTRVTPCWFGPFHRCL